MADSSYATTLIVWLLLCFFSCTTSIEISPFQYSQTNLQTDCSSYYDFFPFPISNHSTWQHGIILGIPIECFVGNKFFLNSSSNLETPNVTNNITTSMIEIPSDTKGVNLQVIYSLVLFSKIPQQQPFISTLACNDLLSLLSNTSNNPLLYNSQQLYIAWNNLYSSSVTCLINSTVTVISAKSAFVWKPISQTLFQLEATNCKITCMTWTANRFYIIGYMSGYELLLNRLIRVTADTTSSTFVLPFVDNHFSTSSIQFVSHTQQVYSTIQCACHVTVNTVTVMESFFFANVPPRMLTFSPSLVNYRFFLTNAMIVIYQIKSIATNQYVLLGYGIQSQQNSLLLLQYRNLYSTFTLVNQTVTTNQRIFFALHWTTDPVNMDIISLVRKQFFTNSPYMVYSDLLWNQFIVHYATQLVHYLTFTSMSIKKSFLSAIQQMTCTAIACHGYSIFNSQMTITSVPLSVVSSVNSTVNSIQLQSLYTDSTQLSVISSPILSMQQFYSPNLLYLQWNNRNTIHQFAISLQWKWNEEIVYSWYTINGIIDLPNYSFAMQWKQNQLFEMKFLQSFQKLIIDIPNAPYTIVSENPLLLLSINATTQLESLQLQYLFDYSIVTVQTMTIPLLFQKFANLVQVKDDIQCNETQLCVTVQLQEHQLFELYHFSQLLWYHTIVNHTVQNETVICVNDLLAGDRYQFLVTQLYHSNSLQYVWKSETKEYQFITPPLVPLEIQLSNSNDTSVQLQIVHDKRNQLVTLQSVIQVMLNRTTVVVQRIVTNQTIIVINELSANQFYTMSIVTQSYQMISKQNRSMTFVTRPSCQQVHFSYQIAHALSSIGDWNLHFTINTTQLLSNYQLQIYLFENETLSQVMNRTIQQPKPIVRQLLPSTKYQIRLYLQNTYQLWSNCYVPLQLYSYAPQIWIEFLDSYADFLLIGWNSLALNDAQDVTYHVTVLNENEMREQHYTIKDNRNGKIRLPLFDITPMTTYSINIETVTLFAQNVTVITPSLYGTPFTTLRAEKPSSAPEWFSVIALSHDSILVAWNKLPRDSTGNAKIQSYFLQCNESSINSEYQKSTVMEWILRGEDNTTFTVTNLKPMTLYTVRVAAINLRGHGPFSEYTSVATLDKDNEQQINTVRDVAIIVIVLFVTCVFSCCVVIGCVIIMIVYGVCGLKKKKKNSSNFSPSLQDWELHHQNSNLLDKRYVIRYEDIDFEQSKFLGKGSYGTVVTAQYKKAPVAVKLFTYDMISGSEQRESFISEAKFLAEHSHHGNIIRFIGVAEDVVQHRLALVTELCTGGNLSEYVLKQKSSFDFETKVQMLHGIASGMSYLHAHNIVHRDLKCENILIESTNMKPKIIDFGLSKQMEGIQQSMQMTMNMGSARYLAPEAIEIEISFPSSGEVTPSTASVEMEQDDNQSTATTSSYDKKCDVYSFAMIMYALYTLNPSIYGERMTDLQIMHRIARNRNFRPPLPSPIPLEHGWYIDLMQQCWSTDPQQRPTFEYICNILEGNSSTQEQQQEAIQSNSLLQRLL